MKVHFATNNSAATHPYDLISSISTESFFVIDIATGQFPYVPPNDIFLCGHSVDDAITLGIDFFEKIIHHEDLSSWKVEYKAVLRYLKDYEEAEDEMVSFSCTFRLQRKYSFHHKPLPQMIKLRMQPIWEDNAARYLVCSIKNSTVKEVGLLRMHSKDGLGHKEYRFTTRRWKQITIDMLTEREKAILTLAMQGNDTKEIADALHRTYHTIRNQIRILFQKLNVNSMLEAIDFASNYHMIYATKDIIPKPYQLSIEVSKKRNYVPLTTDVLQRVQQHLETGKNIRQTAELENVPESTIRYNIKQGKLTKTSMRSENPP
jgi:DNA-binding CsgD family transcriptional regulator